MKTFLSICVTLFVCIHIYLFAENKTVIVSLGPNCQVASVLRQCGLREEAYPFDWLTTYDDEGLIRAINEDFTYFLDPTYLHYYPIHIYNSYYRLSFLHDFPTDAQGFSDWVSHGTIVTNYLDYLPAIQQKYFNRTLRLKNLLESDRRVIFIRPHMPPLSVSNLVQMLKNKYPKLNFLVVSVHNREELNYNWNIDRALSIFIPGRNEADPQAWWPLEIWSYILQQIYFFIQFNP